ncbi:MAG: peptidyl-prolyl cis-trans isomerase [Robiginitomaculum sp.]|nr:peptidyl-prolyl cis-trans isomerase [Robiginitomaculum sp.]
MPKSNSVLAKLIKDPLIHFLILGGLLFVAMAVLGGGKSTQDEIRITKTTQKHLADLFEITWQRKPTPGELKNLTEEHIKEEIYYREALALGLDDNDTIVRRRLRQKLEFMQEDLSSLVEPGEAELMAYYEANKEQYKTDHILSFTQAVIATKKLDANGDEVTKALSMLSYGTAPKSISRSSLLPVSMKLETKRSVTNTFGEDFVEQVLALEPQKWGGPVYSGFGTHLVNVSLNQKAQPLTFTQAKNKVSIDYIQAQREKSAANYYNNLRGQYRIIVEDTE